MIQFNRPMFATLVSLTGSCLTPRLSKLRLKYSKASRGQFAIFKHTPNNSNSLSYQLKLCVHLEPLWGRRLTLAAFQGSRKKLRCEPHDSRRRSVMAVLNRQESKSKATRYCAANGHIAANAYADSHVRHRPDRATSMTPLWVSEHSSQSLNNNLWPLSVNAPVAQSPRVFLPGWRRRRPISVVR
jgi:hypothetical protein